jgi:hypothetical protein
MEEQKQRAVTLIYSTLITRDSFAKFTKLSILPNDLALLHAFFESNLNYEM